jgi:predicted flavoprotein YhiN
VRELGACALPISGHGGYAKAEVTQGGVPLEEVRLETLESRIVPGLHFVGEVLDVTGRLGGYNFLWAWVTGRKAGLAIASSRE